MKEEQCSYTERWNITIHIGIEREYLYKFLKNYECTIIAKNQIYTEVSNISFYSFKQISLSIKKMTYQYCINKN